MGIRTQTRRRKRANVTNLLAHHEFIMRGAKETYAIQGSSFELLIPDGLLMDVKEEGVEDSLLRVLREAQVRKGEMLAEKAESEKIST